MHQTNSPHESILDGCPYDPTKIHGGKCGCGVSEVDEDQDGTPDCIDACPKDPEKTSPLTCGCGVPEVDTDRDGTPDCIDQCPLNPTKTLPMICGCEFNEGECWSSWIQSPEKYGIEIYLEALVVVLLLLVCCMWRLTRRRKPTSSSSVENGYLLSALNHQKSPSPSPALNHSPRASGFGQTLTQRKVPGSTPTPPPLTPVKFGSELRLQQLAMQATQTTLSEDSV